MAAGLVVLQYARPDTVIYALPFSCYLGIACGAITHNHNHCPTFSGRRLNNGFGHLLTLFYGYPTLMWIPTHNMNHHRFINRSGDATITWRYTNKHNLFIASTYFFVSSWFQSEPIKRYIARAKATNPHLYSRIRFQYVLWALFYPAMLALAVGIHHGDGNGTGLYVWFFSVIVPALCSISLIMFFNYVQHVHTDSWSQQDHSRNFTGPVFNFLFFNNGYHTVHHDHQGLHWSRLPVAHAKIADTIAPRLNEGNIIWYLARQYVLALFWPRLGTQQLGAEPGGATGGGAIGGGTPLTSAALSAALHPDALQPEVLREIEPAAGDFAADAAEPAAVAFG
jgi:fatty acid desaturase